MALMADKMCGPRSYLKFVFIYWARKRNSTSTLTNNTK